MKLLFVGTPAFAVPSFKRLAAGSHSIVGVMTQPDQPRGRGQLNRPSAIKELALTHRIPLFQPMDLTEETFLSSIRRLAPDCAVVVAYGRILPKKFLQLFPKGAYNLHASLLPKYRGAAPIQWALIRGETETGVTVFQLDEELDHGPILFQVRTAIQPDESAISLADRLAELGGNTLLETVDRLEAGTAILSPQDHSKATHAPRLTKADGIIQWKEGCIQIHNRVRGVQPWPGATTWLQKQLIKILAAQPDPARNPSSALAPGSIVETSPDHGLWVQTGQGQLRIDLLQPAGGKAMQAADFLRGHPLRAGDIFCQL